MALHFSPDEFDRRKGALLAAIAQARLDGLLLFQQESMYWATGYDTFGFCFFQCLVVATDGRMALLTRSADLRQARHTSIIADVRIWKDAADANPALDLKELCAELGLAGKRLGVEFESYGLVASNGRKLEAAFDGFAPLTDASHLVTRLRAVKSAEEIAHVRRPGYARARRRRGRHPRRPARRDLPRRRRLSGQRVHHRLGRRRAALPLQGRAAHARDARPDHARIRRRLPALPRGNHAHGAGRRPEAPHLAYHRAAREALLACEAELRPGRTAGDVYAAHARVLDERGLGAHRLNACGYSLGAKFTPSWMDWPMFYEANPWQIAPGTVSYTHLTLPTKA